MPPSDIPTETFQLQIAVGHVELLQIFFLSVSFLSMLTLFNLYLLFLPYINVTIPKITCISPSLLSTAPTSIISNLDLAFSPHLLSFPYTNITVLHITSTFLSLLSTALILTSSILPTIFMHCSLHITSSPYISSTILNTIPYFSSFTLILFITIVLRLPCFMVCSDSLSVPSHIHSMPR